MENLEHPSNLKINDIIERLWEIECSLNGLAALIQNQGEEASHSTDELLGIGSLIKTLSREVSRLGEILGRGNDSRGSIQKCSNEKPSIPVKDTENLKYQDSK